MDTKALKDKILQLAIQGKLVEQDKNDEPASVLLDRIKEEREKLIKEGKIRKPKKLPSIEEEEKPFEIPEGWEWVRLGNLVEFKIGKTPKRSNADYWDNGEYPWFSISDIEDGEIIYDSKEKISEKAYTDIFKGDISPKGTLIMSFKLSIGKMSILGVDGFHNEAIISIFPICDSEEITKMYLFKIMNGLDILGD
ncbi:type I restriction enzyme, S subunit [Clostridium cochlearium]|uniref:Type I restriction enzyme, S subunit n=1 Tax=Clostridium cochlearium TaxID=1494 RepID=A0ABY0QJ98_CLOCO|nr:type I restriction enzyme, S subunit [Clostridium cochlearium]